MIPQKLTPAMQQYVAMKQKNPDCILFFRMGDFYEVFFEDATICGQVLDLVITSKNKNSEHPIPMAGIPYHSVDKYIPRLIAQGYKIAIAEQTSTPIPWKIVERAIKTIITPGTYIQEDQKGLSLMLAITRTSDKNGELFHITWGDFTLGEYMTKSFDDLGKVQKMILMLAPKEIVIDVDLGIKEALMTPIQQYLQCLISVYAVPSHPASLIAQMAKVQDIGSFGQALVEGRELSTALLFSYLQHTQQKEISTIAKIALHLSEGAVLLDDITIKNLELFASSYEASSKYSLLGVIDNTKTAGGARLLRSLLQNPINDKQRLEERLENIAYYTQFPESVMMNQYLGSFSDVPKLISLVYYKKLSPLPFLKLRKTLGQVLFGLEGQVKEELLRLGLTQEDGEKLEQLFIQLQELLKEDEEVGLDMNYISDGYDEEIDALRKMAFHSDDLLFQYQQELASASAINNIKLKFVTNQGYFLELTSKDSQLFETFLWEKKSEFLSEEASAKRDISRRQTLKGNQRYSSPYLDSMQEKILGAREALMKKEAELLARFQRQLSWSLASLYQLADRLAWLDLFLSHALFAKEHGFVQPELNEDQQIFIKEGRHPVIEEFLPKGESFIPNSLGLGNHSLKPREKEGIIHIITGPNMGGKSTYLRQSALIVLLAHCGLYVPAHSAKIGLVDGIFARVGSGDIIAKNQSTFMTEMIEVANILHNATEKSFIIFDELGRGTSTYDGLALTQAILHHILHHIKAKTLIATHYHELIALEKESDQVKNFSLGVYETEKEVVFMKKIVPGGASKSYGVDVAQLAGIPQGILQEARTILRQLEQKEEAPSSRKVEEQGLFASEDLAAQESYRKGMALLSQLNLDEMTPLQALQLLMKMKEDCE